MKIIGANVGGDFRVVRQLARGTLARVYLASDGACVKVLKLFPHHAKERAERELRMGRSLEHPHLNPIEAGVEIAGQPGVTMPYVHGVQLSEWLVQADLACFLGCLVHVLESLEYLHGRGIVHRDVKPENILVDTHNAPHLIDFDLAVHIDEPLQKSAGTLAYLSPEQASGEPITPAADLYAVGVLLYRVLTGEVPFSGSVAEVIAAHRETQPPPPSSLKPALSPFDEVCLALLAKDVGSRPSAGELICELERLGREVSPSLELR